MRCRMSWVTLTTRVKTLWKCAQSIARARTLTCKSYKNVSTPSASSNLSSLLSLNRVSLDCRRSWTLFSFSSISSQSKNQCNLLSKWSHFKMLILSFSMIYLRHLANSSPASRTRISNSRVQRMMRLKYQAARKLYKQCVSSPSVETSNLPLSASSSLWCSKWANSGLKETAQKSLLSKVQMKWL